MKKTYNHAYAFAAEVISHDPEGEDVTPAMLITAFRKRLDLIEKNDVTEMLEACDRWDTFEVKE